MGPSDCIFNLPDPRYRTVLAVMVIWSEVRGGGSRREPMTNRRPSRSEDWRMSRDIRLPLGWLAGTAGLAVTGYTA